MDRQVDIHVLQNAVIRGEKILCIHYACESFYSATDHPPAITCIVVSNITDSSISVYSPASYRNGSSEERERRMLDEFHQNLRSNSDARIVHWNMNGANFGFGPIRDRYRWLGGGAVFQPPGDKLHDLDELIEFRYGVDYSRHPKLYNIAALNGCNQRSWLQGKEEAERAESEDYTAITRSTSDKVNAISKLLEMFCSGSLVTQASAGTVSIAGEKVDAVKLIIHIASNMLLSYRSLQRRHDNRPTISMDDEYDTQDLFRSLLVLFFDDVRPESVAPQYAAGSSRVDFLIPDFHLAVELKKSRKTLDSKKLSDELIIDCERYAQDQRVRHLMCIVFDHEGFLANPRGVESDLGKQMSNDGIAVTVRIIDR